jgi:hypothetical protein
MDARKIAGRLLEGREFSSQTKVDRDLCDSIFGYLRVKPELTGAEIREYVRLGEQQLALLC